jgi:hypothetical protein
MRGRCHQARAWGYAPSPGLLRNLAAGLTTIETTPAFGIGQRAILARTPAGNVLGTASR